VFVLSSIVMLLWNRVLVEVLEVHVITFWQAFGILLLARILAGGFHSEFFHHHHLHDRRHRKIRESWMRATPEEREKMRSALRNEWRNRFGAGRS